MWPKRKPSSPGSVARSGRISSLRTSDSRCAPTSARSGSGMRAATAPRWKSRPSTAPRSTAARSCSASRSMRAASSAWSVGGTSSSSAVLGLHRDELLDEERVPLGRLDDSRSRLALESRRAVHEHLAVGVGQRLER